MYEVRSSVKEQLKFLESIDRHSAQCKQEQEREKLLKAAKVRLGAGGRVWCAGAGGRVWCAGAGGRVWCPCTVWWGVWSAVWCAVWCVCGVVCGGGGGGVVVWGLGVWCAVWWGVVVCTELGLRGSVVSSEPQQG